MKHRDYARNSRQVSAESPLILRCEPFVLAAESATRPAIDRDIDLNRTISLSVKKFCLHSHESENSRSRDSARSLGSSKTISILERNVITGSRGFSPAAQCVAGLTLFREPLALVHRKPET